MAHPLTMPSNLQTAQRTTGDHVRQRMSRMLWAACSLAAFLGLATSNPLITCVGLLIPPVLFDLLWRTGEPPVLLFGITFQWLQVMAPVLAGDLNSEPMYEKFQGPEMDQATWLSLVGIVVIALGMRHAVSSMSKVNVALFREQVELISIPRLIRFYLVCFVLSAGMTYLGDRVKSIAQPLYAMATIRWVPVTMLIWKGMLGNRTSRAMIAVVVFEIVIGFTGFFSSFKEVLFLVMIVTAASGTSRGRVPFVPLGVSAMLALLLASYWQAVKDDYRSFLNQGNKQQVTTVSIDRRLKYLVDRATEITPLQLYKGMVSGVDRLGYINYFAYSIRYVPQIIPYQNGELWYGAIMHVVTPRLFFPNKPPISDSKRTRQFTGQNVAGEERGTSVSIGYMGESYIDFGAIGMFFPLLLLGYLYGYIYRYFSRIKGYELLGVSTAVSLLLFTTTSLGQSNIKLMGGVVVGFVGLGLILRLWKERIWESVCERKSW